MSSQSSFEIDGDICQQCQVFLSGALAGPSTVFNQDWDTLQLGRDPSRLFTGHHGSFKVLINSGRNGCAVCQRIVLAVQTKSFMTSGEALSSFAGKDVSYHLWLPSSTDSRCGSHRVAFGFGDLSQYDSSYHARQPMYMELYRRNGSGTVSILGSDPPHEPWLHLPVRQNLDSGSEEVVERAKRWLSNCMKEHDSCSRCPMRLPKRVLDLTTLDKSELVRLYETHGEEEHYVALSYCWGASGALTTVGSNIDAHRQGISIAEFPLTMRQAIRFTRSLGYRYLWIDALCIIQDSYNDWTEQAASMFDVYGMSTLTLSATSSYDCDHGLFARASEHGVTVGRLYPFGQNAGFYNIFFDSFGPEGVWFLNKEFLSTRGWTFQERLVPPRTLHFTDAGVVWECAAVTAQEASEDLWGDRGLKGQFADLVQVEADGSDAQRVSFQKKWNNWVCEYSDRRLTKVSDKLPAMAGIAKAFAIKFGDTYLAGLWASEFVAGLLWGRSYKALSLVRHKGEAIPSWSWASVSGRLSYHHLQVEPPETGVDLLIRNVSVTEKKPGSFGELHTGGFIEAEGMLQRVVLDRRSEMRNPSGPFHPCSVVRGLLPDVKIECWMDQMELADPAEPFECWCLRVCSYERTEYGNMIAFLFLDSQPGSNEFQRIGEGVAEIYAGQGSADNKGDQVFSAGQWAKFRLT